MLWPAFSRRIFAAASALLLWVAVCPAQTKPPVKRTTHRTASKPASHSVSTSHSSSKAHASVSSSHHSTVASKRSSTTSKNKRRKRTVSWRKRGQQRIDPQRAHDIQEALIREHYLDGNPSGVWDDTTQKAMQRYQADQGWQSTMTPDSRALIKLGLGPDHAHLLNPESAMTMTGGGDPPHASEPASSASSPSIPVSSTPLPAGDPAPESLGKK